MTQVLKVYNLALEGPPANPDYVKCSAYPNCAETKFSVSCLSQIKSKTPLKVEVEISQDESTCGFHKLRGKTVVLESY